MNEVGSSITTEQQKFEIKPIIEQKPFENQAYNNFFNIWGKVNDSIQPKILTRIEWNQQSAEKGILSGELEEGRRNLLIPNDLQLWEMVGFMEAVEPERSSEKKEQLLKLGKTFKNSGIYIAQRLNEIPDGKLIAKALAEEYYQYGQSLITGKKSGTENTTEEIALQTLTAEETEEVDRFLSGEKLYASRRARATKQSLEDQQDGNTKDRFENERQKTLAQFFRVAEQAFRLNLQSKEGILKAKSPSKTHPWESTTPIHTAFLHKVEQAMEREITKPKTELVSSIFQRGMDFLQKEMPFDLLTEEVKDEILQWRNGEKTIREGLKLDELKVELELIRQSGDTNAMSNKEREIANKIQEAVSKLEYHPEASYSADIRMYQMVNCVGASSLAGSLLSEAGVKYLVSDTNGHSILLLATSDGNIEWRDMLTKKSNGVLTDEMIEGRTENGTVLAVQDIFDLAQHPTNKGIHFSLTEEEYKNKLSFIDWVKEGQRQSINLLSPEIGHEMQILHNLGRAFFRANRLDESNIAFKQMITLSPESSAGYSFLGDTLVKRGDNSEEDDEKMQYYNQALNFYRTAIAIEPQNKNYYNSMGDILSNMGYQREAIETFRKSITIEPRSSKTYTLLGKSLNEVGQYEEAITRFEQSISINPDYPFNYYYLSQALNKLDKVDEAKIALDEFLRRSEEPTEQEVTV